MDHAERVPWTRRDILFVAGGLTLAVACLGAAAWLYVDADGDDGPAATPTATAGPDNGTKEPACALALCIEAVQGGWRADAPWMLVTASDRSNALWAWALYWEDAAGDFHAGVVGTTDPTAPPTLLFETGGTAPAEIVVDGQRVLFADVAGTWLWDGAVPRQLSRAALRPLGVQGDAALVACSIQDAYCLLNLTTGTLATVPGTSPGAQPHGAWGQDAWGTWTADGSTALASFSTGTGERRKISTTTGAIRSVRAGDVVAWLEHRDTARLYVHDGQTRFVAQDVAGMDVDGDKVVYLTADGGLWRLWGEGPVEVWSLGEPAETAHLDAGAGSVVMTLDGDGATTGWVVVHGV